MLKVLDSINLPLSRIRIKIAVVCLLAAGMLIVPGWSYLGIAGEKRINFKKGSSVSIQHSGSRKNVGHAKSSRNHSRPVIKHQRRHKTVRHHYSNRGHYKSPTGPLVIDVHKALKRKKLKITTYRQNAPKGLNRQVIDNGIGGVRVIYYDDSKCDSGYDCIIRLGNSRSSPKIIVIGEKRMEQPAGPIVIYPPS